MKTITAIWILGLSFGVVMVRLYLTSSDADALREQVKTKDAYIIQLEQRNAALDAELLKYQPKEVWCGKEVK